MSDIKETAPATSIAVLDLHLDYLRRDVAKVVAAVENMATRDDIKRLEVQMSQFVTRDELADLRAQLQRDSVPSTVERWADWIKRIGGAAAVLGGGAVLVSHLVERLK